MGNFSQLMEKQKTMPPQTERGLQSKTKKRNENRPPSRNCHIGINITILQSDVDDLREPTYGAQTLRLRNTDTDILKDTAYLLSKSMKKKVTQSDIARIGIRIVQKLATAKDAPLSEILEQIK